MFIWDKLGRIYNPYDFSSRSQWMYEFTLAPWTLIFDNFIRVYIGTRSKRDKNSQYITYSSYIDLSRSNLFDIVGLSKKPVIKLGNRGCFDEFGTYPLSVIRRENSIWGYYAGWTRCESVPFNVGIGLAISNNNGITFEKVGEGPIIPYSIHEPFTISGPKIKYFDDTYYLFYIAGKQWVIVNGKPEISHKIRMATSKNGIEWTKINRDIISNGWDKDESQASPDVFYRNGLYHMFFDGWIPSSFRRTKKRIIGYAYSKDLFNWTRDDEKAGINLSNDGWDSDMVAYPHIFDLDEETYLLYIGNEVGRYGFGVAKLRDQY